MTTVAVIGAAGWAGSRHAQSFHREGASVTYVVDPASPAADLAKRIGAAHVRAVEDIPDRVDLAVVALPPAVQPPVISEFLRQGSFVLSEKPVAPTVAETSELQSMTKDLDRLFVGFTLRHHPALQLIQRWRTGREIVIVKARSVAHKPTVEGWRRESSSGGITLVNAVHVLDFVPHLFDAVPTVDHVRLAGVFVPNYTEDYLEADSSFDNGMRFKVESYWAPFKSTKTIDGDWDLTVELLAQDGRLVWKNNTVTIQSKVEEPVAIEVEPISLFDAQARAVLTALETGERPPTLTTLAQANQATQLANRIRQLGLACQ